MRETTCAVCAEPFNGQPAYLVQGARWIRRRWWAARLQICAACHNGRRGYWNDDFRVLPVRWLSLVGRGEQMPPTPCTVCGQPVVRNADPGLKRVTCSHSCSTSVTRSRNGNQGSGQPCETCGAQITSGRADARYCSAKCRQKAYRQRNTSDTHGNAAPPLLDARGRRYPQRSQRKALEAGIPALSGLCGQFLLVGEVEGAVAPSELQQWRTELAEAERIVGGLHRKLQSRSQVEDSPVDDRPNPGVPARRKNLAAGTAALSGLCAGLDRVTVLDEDITPDVAAQWQAEVAEALAGIRRLLSVLEQISHAQP